MSRALARRGASLLLTLGLSIATCLSAAAPATAPATARLGPSVLAAARLTATLDDAKAKATALRLAVDQLRNQAEQATEAYDAAYAELGRVVTEHLSAQQALDTAVSNANTQSDAASRRVRALYMSGGTSALYASVLQGTDISDVLSRIESVRRVVNGDSTAKTSASSDVASRRSAEARLASLADRQTVLQAAVADRADQVRALLAQTDTLLSQADLRVRQIADAERRAAEQAAAARAAASLARAQAEAQRQAALALLPTSVAAPTPAAGAAIAAAMTHLGQPYLWGGTGPDAFDCSGLTQTAYAAAGIALPRVAADQWYSGPQVGLGDLQPGDLLFWAFDVTNPATIHHVALYIGNGLMIAAPHTGDVVKVEPVYLDGFIGAVRPSAVSH